MSKKDEDRNLPNAETQILQADRTRIEQAETRTMEQVLRASELSYRRLFEAARDGILLLDVDTGRITDVNPFLVELLGFSHDAMVGKTVGELSPFKDIEENKVMLSRLQKDGYVRYENLPLETRDGRKKAVEFVSNVYQAGDKKVIQCNVRDITERKRTEAALLRLAAIVESSDDAIIGKDLNGVITSWNSGAEKIFGYTAGEIVGTSIMRLIPIDRQGEENQILEQVKCGESVEHFDTVRQTKDGRLIDISITASPIKDAAGRVTGVSKVARDISERKRIEESLRQIQARLKSTLAAGSIGTWTWDVPNDCLTADQFTARMFSIETAAAAKGLPAATYLQAVFEKDQSGVADSLARAIQSCGHYDVEYRVRQKDGELHWLQARGRVDCDGAGKALNFHGAVIDITERKLAQEKIQELNIELEQRVTERTAQLQSANEELEAFSYSVSHDLRAPLRHVMGFVNLLQKDAGPSLSEKNVGYLTTISLAAKRMGNLIDDLLTFARVGRAEIQKANINLDELVRETLDDFQAETNARTIVWEIQPLPPVRADRALLRLVLVNLISNAVKFTSHRAEAKIEIGCVEMVEGRGSKVESQTAPPSTLDSRLSTTIFVRDNGAGFDPQYAGKLFGVFQRLHSSEEFEGTGIGLANVQRIIHRFGGRVWAEGKVDGGATFCFSIPKPNGDTNAHTN
jgi:PAS domain S-box-containing protein